MEELKGGVNYEQREERNLLGNVETDERRELG